jgi:predicted enzyme related to lactoylglutathione lyase
MSLRPADIVIDCVDHGPVVAFWAAALGWKPRHVNEQYVSLAGPDAGTVSLLFQKVPEAKVVKNRVHIDFRCEDRVAETERLVGLGATVIAAERCLGRFCWTVLADPAGNEFCINSG